MEAAFWSASAASTVTLPLAMGGEQSCPIRSAARRWIWVLGSSSSAWSPCGAGGEYAPPSPVEGGAAAAPGGRPPIAPDWKASRAHCCVPGGGACGLSPYSPSILQLPPRRAPLSLRANQNQLHAFNAKIYCT